MAVNRIKHSSVAPFANDRQLDRVQTLGVSGRLDSEDISEIGNLDIVEVVDNTPTVDITLDTNQYGSNKTLFTLAGKNFDGTNVVVTKTGAKQVTVQAGKVWIDEMEYDASAQTYDLVQGAGASGNKHRIVELSWDISGGAVHLEKTFGINQTTLNASGIPTTPAGNLKFCEIELTINANASGVLEIDPTDIAMRGPLTEVDLKDFEFATVDIVAPVKERGDNTDVTYPISRTMLVDKAYVNRYDASFSVNGLATENFSLEADNKTWFLNKEANFWVDRINGSGAGPYTLSYTPVVRPSGFKTIKARKYDWSGGTYAELIEDSSGALGFSVSGNKITFETALVDTNETVIVRYTAPVNASGQMFFQRVPAEVTGHPAIAGGLKQGQVEVYLSDDLVNRVLRLQSVTISTSLTREPLYEIGAIRSFDRPLTFPIPITLSLEATASDLKEFARLCGLDYEASGTVELSINDFVKNLDMHVLIYRENDETRDKAGFVCGQWIKKIVVENLTMTDENTEVRVNQNGTQTWGMKANTQMHIQSVI
jgi:hypothetical protein